jgi:DNA ligase-1
VGDQYDQLSDVCHLTVGVPVKPMLAKPSSGIDDVLKTMDKKQFTCEFKYDGIRAQIHYQRDPALFKIYNRRL